LRARQVLPRSSGAIAAAGGHGDEHSLIVRRIAGVARLEQRHGLDAGSNVSPGPEKEGREIDRS
jgi:hypothetical protein